MEYLEKGESSGSDLVERIKAAVEKAKYNEEWRHEYMVMNLHLSDARNEGFEEGCEEGREEGRALAARENAVNAIKLNIDPETICKITNLDMNTVLMLKEQVYSE